MVNKIFKVFIEMYKLKNELLELESKERKENIIIKLKEKIKLFQNNISEK